MLNSDAIIIGVDPGLAITGYGVIRHLTIIEYGVIRTPSRQPISDRLVQLYQQINQLLDRYQPTVAGCERLFFAKNVKTASDVGQARGVLLLALAQHHIHLVECTPAEVKQAVTGYGSASKQQMQHMIQTIFHLDHLPKPDDAADALAIALTSASVRHYRQL
ncbi:MAG: crossover junction endodeoxyribonuclease RuvC [Candidatus Kerfeldbacteria bacterium]|nr:crossover junction endodeoxyribonuclease RuvC [Candidatus Kerfeldbacteria bacterium]